LPGKSLISSSVLLAAALELQIHVEIRIIQLLRGGRHFPLASEHSFVSGTGNS
jgi:hypothetical protein